MQRWRVLMSTATAASDASNDTGLDEHLLALMRRKRLQAKFVDVIILVVPWLALFYGASIMLAAERLISLRSYDSTWRSTAFDVLFWSCFVYPAGIILVQAFMLARRGQTLGKRMTNLAVTLPDGERAGFTRAVLLRAAVSNLLYGIPVVGQFAMVADIVSLWSIDGRCLHDRLAGTVVRTFVPPAPPVVPDDSHLWKPRRHR